MSLPSTSATLLHGPLDIRVDNARPLWPAPPGHATVQIEATGLCGSDLHYYLHGRNGDFKVRAPLVLGHEAAGVIVALGPPAPTPGAGENAGPRLKVGMRVAIECGVMCGTCGYCTEGRYNLCKNMRFCSSAKTFPHLDGTLQEKMNHPVHLLHPIPDNVSYEQAALAEPLSVLIHSARRVGLSPPTSFPYSPSASSSPYSNPLQNGTSQPEAPYNFDHANNKSVLVFGTGAIGLLACLLARVHGAKRVVALDINQERLSFARDHGLADEVYCLPLGKPASGEDALEQAQATITTALSTLLPTSADDDKGVEGADIVFECTGAPSCIQQSVFAAKPGGKVILIGMGSRNVVFPVSAAATREVDILGSFRYARTYGEALALIGSGRLKGKSTPEGSEGKELRVLEDMVTHRFALKDVKEAFELMRKGRDEQGRLCLKVVVNRGSSSA